MSASEKKPPVANISTFDRYEFWDRVALEIYVGSKEFLLVPHRGGESVAKRCYALAQPLVEMADKVRQGFDVGTLTEKPRMTPVEYVDDDSGEKIVRMEPVSDCHCPNQPRDYPLNQRAVYFLDGHDKEDAERIAEAELPSEVSH